MKRFNPIESMANARHEFGEHGGVNMCIESSTTFTVLKANEMPALFLGEAGPEQGHYLYGRHFNPTVYTLGRYLAAMEGTEAGYCTASGMSAIATIALQLLEAGDHAVVSHTIYGGTFALFDHILRAKMNLKIDFVDVSDVKSIEKAVTDKTKLLYVETMANPTLVVPDIPRLAEIAHRNGAPLVVDNTFCPVIVSPAQLGADIVVHSLTKFINGSSDAIAGAICADKDFIRKIMNVNTGALMLLGATMDPHVAFEVSMRLPHLGMRMAEHSRRALYFAERLQDLGLHVVYPGLPNHPQHELFTKLMNPGFGYSGMLGVDCGSTEKANRLMEILQNKERFGFIAVSLGYFENLMSCSAVSTSSELSEEEQRRAGILPGLLRIAVGYTGTVEQRWDQLHRALQEAGVIPHTTSV